MNRNRSTPTLLKRRAIALTTWLSAAILLVVSSISVAFAANPPPVQNYYIPVPEDQVYRAFKSIYPSRNTCH